MAITSYSESVKMHDIIVTVLRDANKNVDTEALWPDNLEENGEVTWDNDIMFQKLEDQGYNISEMEPIYNGFIYKGTNDGGINLVYATVMASEILPAQKTYDFVPYEPGGLAGMKSVAKLTAAEVRQFQNWWASLPFMEQRHYQHRINSAKQVEGYEDHGHTRVINGKITRIPDIKIRVVYNVL